MEKHEGGGGDGADAPGAEADAAQRLEGGLEQGIAAFGRSPGGRVQQVDGALIVGQWRVGALLDRRGSSHSRPAGLPTSLSTASNPRVLCGGASGGRSRTGIPTRTAPPSLIGSSPTISAAGGLIPSCAQASRNSFGSGFARPCSQDN